MLRGNEKESRHKACNPLEACQYRCSTLTFFMQQPEVRTIRASDIAEHWIAWNAFDCNCTCLCTIGEEELACLRILLHINA
nr:MAG TPA: hypothetical protein [Crassvirales sp.]